MQFCCYCLFCYDTNKTSLCYLYGSSGVGGKIELQKIVNGLIITQIHYSPRISIVLIFIIIGIGFKLSPTTPSHHLLYMKACRYQHKVKILALSKWYFTDGSGRPNLNNFYSCWWHYQYQPSSNIDLLNSLCSNS